MFVLRRAALRVLSQPTRQTLAIRPILRSASIQSQKPLGTRAFHQSRSWFAEEDNKRSAEPESGSRAPSESAGIAEQARDAAASAVRKTQEVVSDTFKQATAATARNTTQGQETSVYLGNLFYETTTEQLEAELSRFGEVTSARVIVDTRGNSKGYGFVEFATSEGAQNAVKEFDQKVFQGRRITAQLHVPRYSKDERVGQFQSKNPPSDTLYIGNMSYQMSDRDLNDLFRDVRDVLDVRVAIDRRSGQPRGFAHADFANVAAAERAKEQLESKFIYGRKLRVDFGVGFNRAKGDRAGEQPEES